MTDREFVQEENLLLAGSLSVFREAKIRRLEAKALFEELREAEGQFPWSWPIGYMGRTRYGK